jgi:hypothetical protein
VTTTTTTTTTTTAVLQVQVGSDDDDEDDGDDPIEDYRVSSDNNIKIEDRGVRFLFELTSRQIEESISILNFFPPTR